MKDIEVKWKENVNEAKIHLKSNRLSQMEIAELALEVCEVVHGGGSKNSLFTIAKFAKDIGISEKTLQNWCITKRNVYDKLSAELKNKITYGEILVTATQVNRDTPRELVNKRAYDAVYTTTLDTRLIRYCKNLRSIAYNFSRMEAAQRADTKVTSEILFYCEKIIKVIKANGAYVTPEDHGITRKANSTTVSEFGNITEDYNLKEKEETIYKYLLSRNGPSSPTTIGQTLGGHNTSNASAWALRSLYKLVDAKLVTKTEQGLYYAINNKNIKPQYLEKD